MSWKDGYKDTRIGGGGATLPYKEYPVLFLRQDIEDRVV